MEGFKTQGVYKSTFLSDHIQDAADQAIALLQNLWTETTELKDLINAHEGKIDDLEDLLRIKDDRIIELESILKYERDKRRL